MMQSAGKKQALEDIVVLECRVNLGKVKTVGMATTGTDLDDPNLLKEGFDSVVYRKRDNVMYKIPGNEYSQVVKITRCKTGAKRQKT